MTTRVSFLRLELAVIASQLLHACGGAQPAIQVSPGDPEAAPAIRSLPSLLSPRETWPENMRLAWDTGVSALELEAPIPPPALDASALEAWSRNTLGAWVTEEQHQMELARTDLLDSCTDDRGHYVMAKTLIGLMEERAGLAMMRVPVPSDFADEPIVVEAFQSVVEGHARPFFRKATRAYKICERAAGTKRAMLHWARYCEQRRERLPRDAFRESSEPAPKEGTEVEIIKVE